MKPPRAPAALLALLILAASAPHALAQAGDGGAGGGGPAPAPVWAVVATVAGLALLAALFARRVSLGPPESPRGEMSLREHLEELQHRLMVILIAVGFFTLFFFSFGPGAVEVAGYRVLLPVPTIHDSFSAVALEHVKAKFLPEGVELVVLRPIDGVMAQLTVTVFLAILAALPVIAYEAGAFMAPGLMEDEKRFILRTVPLVTALFLIGAAFAYAVMIPITLDILYGYATAVGATPYMLIGELVSFPVLLMLLFGLAFELPVVMVALVELGLVTPEAYTQRWRHAVVVIMIVAAVVSDPSIVSQLLVGGPLVGLYGIGVAASRWRYKRRPAPAGATGADE